MDVPKVKYEEMRQKICFEFSVNFMKSLFINISVKLYK